jgi:hypothetical protein
MTRSNFATSLGFGAVAFIWLIQPTPAQAFHLLEHSYSHVGVGSPVWKVAEDCPPGTTFSIARGKCVCPPGMKAWPAAAALGGLAGCYDPKNPSGCAPGTKWDQSEGRCVKKPIKEIGTPKDPEKKALKVACESNGNKWDYGAGRCIKSIKRTKPPTTSGGAGGE